MNLRMNLGRLTTALTVALVLAPTSSLLAAGWGSVEGQFVLDGDIPNLPPKVKKGDSTAKDAAVCAAQDVPDESLVVDEETKGIQHILIYLRRAPEIHPDLKSSAEEKVVFDQDNCRFMPHTMLVRTDQVVTCKSSDSVAHNVHTSPFANAPSNFIVQPNDETGMDVKMPIPESIAPVKVTCDIHPWMIAWWLVLDHPYMAITDSYGKFKIENLPEGTHEFRVWQEKAGYIDRKFSVTIKDGEVTKLDPVKVPVSAFKD